MQTDKFFDLNNNHRTQQFSFEKHYSYISIKKIVITSLLGYKPDEWFSKLKQSNPFLKIKFTNSRGETLEYSIVIASLVSSYHAQPVFEFQDNFIIPAQNMLTYYNNATIDLCFFGDEDTDLKMTLLYQTTLGADAK